MNQGRHCVLYRRFTFLYCRDCSPFLGLINILSFLTELEAHHLRVILELTVNSQFKMKPFEGSFWSGVNRQRTNPA